MCVFVATSTEVKVNGSGSSDFQRMMRFTIRSLCAVLCFEIYWMVVIISCLGRTDPRGFMRTGSETRPGGAERFEGLGSHAAHFVFAGNFLVFSDLLPAFTLGR